MFKKHIKRMDNMIKGKVEEKQVQVKKESGMEVEVPRHKKIRKNRLL